MQTSISASAGVATFEQLDLRPVLRTGELLEIVPGLIEDASVESRPTTLVNLEAGYRFNDRLKLSAAMFNVFDSKDSDVAYFYESQLPGEAAPVEDLHFHPVEPRTMRLTFATLF